MKKILYINNFEAPYRVPFYNLLADKFDLTLAVTNYATDDKVRNKNWAYSGKRKYNIKYLRCIKIFGKKISFNILKMIKDYDMVFMDMYGNFTNLLVIFMMKYVKRQKFIISVDGMLINENESKISIWLKTNILKCPYKILSPGDYVDNCLRKYGVDNEKLIRYHFTSVLENDICNEQVDRVKLRNELNYKEEKIIIAVGSFIPRKGFDVLLRAANRLSKSYGVYIIGDDPTKDALEYCKRHKLDNVHFVGFKAKDELKKYYQAADLFVLPTRTDIWGLVINEAMASGLPIVTTDRCVAGIEMVENGINGYIIPVDDVDSLVEKCNRILSDEKLKEQMSINNLKKSYDYTIEKMAQKHIEVFERFLNNEI